MADISEFLNPNSTLTPGIAGGLTTAVTMPLVVSFDLKFKLVALVISFLFALLIVQQFKEQIGQLQRAIYSVLNSLIIFSVSVGAGINLDPPPPVQPKPDPAIEKLLERIQPRISEESTFLGISQAYAQSEPPQPPREELRREPERWQPPAQPRLTREEAERLQEYIKQQQQQQEKQEQYYRRWSW